MDILASLADGAPGSALLLAAMVGASLWGLYVSPPLVDRHLFRPYWLLRRREYVTLVTNGFLHADLPHLLFNAFTFWAFAFGLERTLGTPTFLALYAFGLLFSDAGTYVKHQHDPAYRCLGASGAILAVLFASILYFPSGSIFILPIPFPIPSPVFAVAYLAYTYYAAGRGQGRVNHDAHLAGAVAGVLFVALTDMDTLAQAVRVFMDRFF